MMRQCFLMGLLFLSSIFCSTPTQSQQPSYDAIIAFGDSLSDTGLSFAATGIPPNFGNNFPYFEGRFSNGPIWIDFLQQGLGLQDQQVLNFAVGGSSTGFGFREPPSGIFDTPPGTLLPTVGVQIETYLQVAAPGPKQLFIVWAGSNDLLNQDLPFTAALNMERHIRRLAGAGAREFLIPNLSPIGNTPAVSGTFEGFILNLFTVSFNQQLARRLNRLERELGIKIHRLDVFTLSLVSSTFPEYFGFSNTSNAALTDIGAGLISPTQGASYVYWDVVHPTSLTHSYIAQMALQVLAK